MTSFPQLVLNLQLVSSNLGLASHYKPICASWHHESCYSPWSSSKKLIIKKSYEYKVLAKVFSSDIQFLDLDPGSILTSVPLVTLWMSVSGSLGLTQFWRWGRGMNWVVRMCRSKSGPRTCFRWFGRPCCQPHAFLMQASYLYHY